MECGSPGHCGTTSSNASTACDASSRPGRSACTPIPRPQPICRLGRPPYASPSCWRRLDLRDVTLVGNDTGGGLCLAALGTQHPGLQRIGRLVLTNCDSYEHFPPKGFDTMVALMRRSPASGSALLCASSHRAWAGECSSRACAPPGRRPAHERAPSSEPSPTARRRARTLLRVTQSLEPSVTLDAVDDLRSFSRPVLLAWGAADKLLSAGPCPPAPGGLRRRPPGSDRWGQHLRDARSAG